jgi:hypothetical protein
MRIPARIGATKRHQSREKAFQPVFAVQTCPLPDHALLARYRSAGAFTDCFVTNCSARVTQAQFVRAFYTTPVFKLERLILAWALGKPSTDAGAAQLAAGTSDIFSAWRVECRTEDQLLLADVQGRTRSWLMTAGPDPAHDTGNRHPHTRLYFGSAILRVANKANGHPELGAGFRALAGFHKVYSAVLLASARQRLATAAR